MKYAWIAEQRKAFPLADRCDVLKVSVRGYRAWQRGGVPDHVPAVVTPVAGTTLCVLSEAREPLTKRFHVLAIDAEIASPDAG